MAAKEHLLVFGATGAIGRAISSAAVSRGWLVTGVARHLPEQVVKGVLSIAADAFAPDFDVTALASDTPFTSVCWAQGTNTNDSVHDVDVETHLDLYRANCLYILITMKALLGSDLLQKGSRMCVISSIWQNLARQRKLSYCMTKAALEGLVLSASADLAGDGHLINAVLPGALGTPMTRRNLSAEQIDRLTSATGFGRLASLEDVANVVCYLCSSENTGITGQFIAADLGFSRVRIV